MLTFKQSKTTSGHLVYDGEQIIGSVHKSEHWTVRGSRVDWTAYRKGRAIGSAHTRKEAAALLVQA